MTDGIIDRYYRNALRIGEPRKQGPPRPPKQPVIHDFQFYPPQLQALLDKETAAFRKRLEWTKAKEEREKEEAEKKEKDGGTAAAGAAAADEKEPDFGELTPEEEAAKAKMLGQGLSTWTRYVLLVNSSILLASFGCQRCGCSDA